MDLHRIAILAATVAQQTVATVDPHASDFETVGPLTMSRAHWQLFEKIGNAFGAILIALVLVRLIPLLERLVIRFANKHSVPKAATASVLESRQRFETLTKVTSSLASALIWTTTVIVVLGDLGIAIAPLLATAGIAGVAIGFGAQSVVKDFFSGFFILLENQFDVGDTITIGSHTGTVERMTLRITVLRDQSGTAHFIPNSTITTVSNRTYGWGRALLDVPFSGTVALDEAHAILTEVAKRATEKLKADEILLEPVTVEGPTEFTPAGVTWRLIAKSRGDFVGEARRILIETLTEELRGKTFRTRGKALSRAVS